MNAPRDSSPTLSFDQHGFEASLTDSVPDAPQSHAAPPASRSAARPRTPATDDVTVERPGWVGKMLGRFRLMRLLGEGTMGRVIQAEDVHLHRIVALKVLRTQIHGMDEHERVEHFLREARAAAQLDHPSVVRIYEINEHHGWWYIAMEMLEGQTLRELVQHTGPLPPAKACMILSDAADALAAAHDLGIIHRDIKPNNLMISRSGRCKLTDFGLVHYEDPADPFGPTDRTVGTPQYMPPETVRRQPPTPASDVYSLAATLYFALTAKPPFPTADARQAMQLHLTAQPPDPRALNPAVSESLARVLRRALSKEPHQRPTAAEFASALRCEFIGSDASHATFVAASHVGASTLLPQPQPATARWAIPVAAAVTGAALAIAALMLWSPPLRTAATRPQPRPPVATTTVDKLFPESPASYGVREPGQWPAASLLSDPPFGWKLSRADATATTTHVAARGGRYYFPIDDPRAALIRADQVKIYPSATAALADGKTPAP